MEIISVSPHVARKWISPLRTLLTDQDAIIESVGNNSGLLHLVGQKFPINTYKNGHDKRMKKKLRINSALGRAARSNFIKLNTLM
jgi:hypothetical protein